MQTTQFEIISRKRARAEGLKYYYTGVPCKYGHLAKRYTIHASCTGCDNMARERYKLEGNEEYRAKVKAGHDRWLKANPLRVRLQAIKSNAKRRGIYFDLELSDLAFPTHCKICLTEFAKFVTARIRPNTATVDRVDSTKGYIKGNIDFICHRCNSLKADSTLAELELVVKYVRDHLQASNHRPER